MKKNPSSGSQLRPIAKSGLLSNLFHMFFHVRAPLCGGFKSASKKVFRDALLFFDKHDARRKFRGVINKQIEEKFRKVRHLKNGDEYRFIGLRNNGAAIGERRRLGKTNYELELVAHYWGSGKNMGDAPALDADFVLEDEPLRPLTREEILKLSREAVFRIKKRETAHWYLLQGITLRGELIMRGEIMPQADFEISFDNGQSWKPINSDLLRPETPAAS